MSARIRLQGRLDLNDAEPLANRLRSVRGADVDIDASQVTHLGSLCQQVLLSAATEWNASGHKLKLVAPTTACLEQLSLCGLSPDFIEEHCK